MLTQVLIFGIVEMSGDHRVVGRAVVVGLV
jgi:hypothetical protein